MLSFHYNMCPFRIYTFNIILGTNSTIIHITRRTPTHNHNNNYNMLSF
ncbi:hypothetical protein KSS87_021561 [Heliosperma pusillum]|nr:hypothetical protein KSS87_021561 [Heliosperma pusillum]